MSARKHQIDNGLEVTVDLPPGSGKRGCQPHVRAVRPSGHSSRTAETSGVLATIMVATDFSENAAHAVSRASMLAESAGLSKAILLHVLEEARLVPSRRVTNSSMNATSRQVENAKRQIAGVAEQLRQGTGLIVEDHVESGHVITTIQCFAATADLLVLGAQGAHPMRDLVIGSTAHRVIRDTPGPVLIARHKAEAPYRQVLVAVDFQSEPSNALKYAQALAPGARLNLVHAYDIPFEGKMRYASVSNDVIDFYRAQASAAAARRMSELISAHAPAIAIHPLLVHGNAAPKLLEMERELGIDLIVVIKRKKSFTETLFLESVTSKVLEGSQCDVLVVR